MMTEVGTRWGAYGHSTGRRVFVGNEALELAPRHIDVSALTPSTIFLYG